MVANFVEIPYIGWHCANAKHPRCDAVCCVCNCHDRGVVFGPTIMRKLHNQYRGTQLNSYGDDPNWKVPPDKREQVTKERSTMPKAILNNHFFLVINGDTGQICGSHFTTEEQATDEAKNLAGATDSPSRPKYYVLESKTFVQRPAPEMPVVNVVKSE